MKRSGLMLIKIETSRVLQEVREIDGIQENMEIEFNMEHGSIDSCQLLHAVSAEKKVLSFNNCVTICIYQ